jgi:hypothetical protein
MESRIAIGDALRGLEIPPLPEGWTPVETVCIVKCLNPEGTPLWVRRLTQGINPEEVLGALTVQAELWKQEMLDDWTEDE